MINTSAQTKSEKLYKESRKHITSGTCTYSKSANRYVESIYPYFIEGGQGPFVFDLDNNSYIDYPCALGAIILGYSNHYVNERVVERIRRGTLFSMPSIHEMELAKEIEKLIPSMESVRFLKSGSEAVSAAVKIARAYTGRDIVLSSGYHGWHDWSTPITSCNGGTPESFSSTIIGIDHGNTQQIEEAFKKSDNIACIVIDPYVFDEPKEGYFDKLIRIAHRHGALVIFDEVVTGIRWRDWAVQNAYCVKPDLTCLGKTLANGIPISCVGGRRKIMEVLNNNCFVSSTFGGDLIGIEGALATLRVARDNDLPIRLEESGAMLQEGFNELTHQFSLDARCVGNPARQRLDFPTPTHKAVFWQECLKDGVFLGGAQHTSLAHTEPIISRTIEVFKDALLTMRLKWDNPKALLRGKLPEPVSTISSLRR